MGNEIQSDKQLRISMSGMSIRTGWGDEKRIIAVSPVPVLDVGKRPLEFQEWLENAEKLCALWNRESKAIELLREVAEWLGDRADADQPAGCDHPIPNDEMRMLIKIEELLK